MEDHILLHILSTQSRPKLSLLMNILSYITGELPRYINLCAQGLVQMPGKTCLLKLSCHFQSWYEWSELPFKQSPFMDVI